MHQLTIWFIPNIFKIELIQNRIYSVHFRHTQRAILKRKLETGINIHMPAPRRIGKTWTINRLAEDLRKENWLIVELDVQGMSEPGKFARRLCQKIEGQLPATKRMKAAVKGRIDNLLDGDWGTNPIEAIGKVDPVEFLDVLLAELAPQSEKSAIFVDEIAFFVLNFANENPEEAKNFFYRLRNLQSEHADIRWLFTGSIGLNIVAERFGLGGAFVDLETFILEPFTVEEARSFLRDDATQQAFNHAFHASDEDLDVLFRELGWLAPFYLKLVANEVRPSGEADKGVLTATRDDLMEAFERLLRPARTSEFAVWTEHIDKNLPAPDRELARMVLDRLSRNPDGESLDTLFAALQPPTRKAIREVLNILENDGLVDRAGKGYRFRSGLIRRYWERYEAE